MHGVWGACSVCFCVCVCVLALMPTPHALVVSVEFIFHHYDEDGGGTLEIPEAQKIIEDMYGRDYKKFKEPRK